MRIAAQPILVNTSPYGQVKAMSYDSLNEKIFFNVLTGCPIWNVPCAYTYTPALGQMTNKHNFSDNTVSTVLNSYYQYAPPWYPVNRVSSAEPRQAVYESNFVYTNYGYYFNKINDTNLTTIWSYSAAVNPSYKEVSTFQIKNDSVFFMEKDSTSTNNYYTLFIKHKLTGADITYSSINAVSPLSSLGAIEGYINNSVLVNNKIVLSGVFTASISGNFVARNLVIIDIATGQLQVPPVAFAVGSSIFDMKINKNKIYIVGQFTDINGQVRNNYAVLDYNLNLLPEAIQFQGVVEPPANTWADKIVFYDDYVIVKGNYAKTENYFNNWTNQSLALVVKTATTNTVMPWIINLPGTPQISNYMFEMFKNKLYIKNKPSLGSPFYIYCFEPVVKSSNILFPGSTMPIPSTSIAICAPSNGDENIFTAPIRYAQSYNWTYSGANATIVPQPNPSTAKLIIDNTTTNGILSVTGTNDCGLTTVASTLNVIIKLKPTFTLPVSPQTIVCNPDSILLQGSTTNTMASIWWRKSLAPNINTPPFYTKTSGSYYMVTLDNSNGCLDSGIVMVNTFKAKPNSKIISHIYPGAIIPIDTVTCYKPLVNIIAASDTAGVVITWKSISNNSVFANPFSTALQSNMKVLVTRSINNCVDSSIIVLVGQNNLKPNVIIPNPAQEINCSYYSASLVAVFSPSYCTTLWNGPQSYTSNNNGNTSNTGKYYSSVTNTVNGCLKLDSISVTSSNRLALRSSNDTMVCKGSFVNISSVRIGTLTGVTYSWNTGSSSNSIAVNPTITSNYIICANGSGNCVGSDTIKVIIPSDIQDSVIAYRSCDNSQTGSIVMFAKGGVPPYNYSINNGLSFSASNSFTNIPFGIYNLVIRDFIGCLRTTAASINSLSSLPVPKFLASTNNFRSDTIVLVDISIPKADSIQWSWPPQVSLIGGTMFNPVIITSDTGAFIITMKAFYGNCFINTTKLIRFGKQDSLIATHYNANGIKTFNLYPNPNTGQFTVFVEFYKKQNASIQAWDTSPYNYLQQNFYNVESITLPVNLNHLQNGSYILRVIGEFDAKNKSFIISK